MEHPNLTGLFVRRMVYGFVMAVEDRIAEQMRVLGQRFRVRCSERSVALSQACDERDLASVRSLAHDITGGAGLFGFPALSQEAQQLSEACRNGCEEETFRMARALSASMLALAAKED